MIYDRGFEIRLTDSFKVFFYFYYDTLEGHRKQNHQNDSHYQRREDSSDDSQYGFNYYNECGSTLTGWFTIQLTEHRVDSLYQYDLGCGYARRSDKQKTYVIKEWIDALFYQNSQISYSQMNKEILKQYDLENIHKRMKRRVNLLRKHRQLPIPTYSQKYDLVNRFVKEMNEQNLSFKSRLIHSNINR